MFAVEEGKGRWCEKPFAGRVSKTAQPSNKTYTLKMRVIVTTDSGDA